MCDIKYIKHTKSKTVLHFTIRTKISLIVNLFLFLCKVLGFWI